MQGVYGVFLNIDSYSVGEEKEIFLGMRIFEVAKQVRNVRQYVWSGLDYVGKVRIAMQYRGAVSADRKSRANSCRVTTRSTGQSTWMERGV